MTSLIYPQLCGCAWMPVCEHKAFAVAVLDAKATTNTHHADLAAVDPHTWGVAGGTMGCLGFTAVTVVTAAVKAPALASIIPAAGAALACGGFCYGTGCRMPVCCVAVKDKIAASVAAEMEKLTVPRQQIEMV